MRPMILAVDTMRASSVKRYPRHPTSSLHRQMLLHHFRAQLTALARHHYGPFGHHHILLRKASGKVEPLLDQQNRKPSLLFEPNDYVFDMIYDRRLNAFSRFIEQKQLGIRQNRAANR